MGPMKTLVYSAQINMKNAIHIFYYYNSFITRVLYSTIQFKELILENVDVKFQVNNFLLFYFGMSCTWVVPERCEDKNCLINSLKLNMKME